MKLLKSKGKYWYYGIQFENGVYLKVSNVRPEFRYFGYFGHGQEANNTFDRWSRTFGLWWIKIECSRLQEVWLSL